MIVKLETIKYRRNLSQVNYVSCRVTSVRISQRHTKLDNSTSCLIFITLPIGTTIFTEMKMWQDREDRAKCGTNNGENCTIIFNTQSNNSIFKILVFYLSA